MAMRHLEITFDVRVGTILCTIREKGAVVPVAEAFGDTKAKALAAVNNIANLSPYFTTGTGILYTPGKGRRAPEHVKLTFGRTTGLSRG